ncbi:MAG: CheB methylesterase [Caulobacteraceae bacterium]|nr:CheB methylesterase [Caulobacteraceae bacterium]
MSGAPIRAVVIGASAGAVQALAAILPKLPPNYPLAVLLVVHVPPDRDNALIPLFEAKCRMRVKEAEDKEPIAPSTLYFSPSDYHLLVERDLTLSLSLDPPVNFSRPSIDVLFQSAADAFGSDLTGVVLTGANQDGAEGLSAIARAGGAALVEDPATAYAGAMPNAALAACPSALRLSLEGIASHLLGLATI